MDPLQQLARNVKAARKKRRWTQEDLADRTGLAQVQISRIERGVRNIRFTTLIRLVVAFEGPDELFDGLYEHSPNSSSSRRQASRSD